MADAPLLEARNITKRFGYLPVLKGVDLTLRSGELVLLLGPNGAGKTTFTRVAATLTRPSGGQLLLDGAPLGSRGQERLRRRLGYLSHQTFLYGHLTARENLEFFGGLYGVGDTGVRIPDLLEQMGLSRAANRLAGTFSRGMQQRLSLARVLLTDPDLLVLDEPYTGLDPQGTETLTSVLAGLKAAHRALLLVTHELEACLPIADRVAILVKGRVVFDGPAAGLGLEGARGAYRQAVGSGAGPAAGGAP
jgi:heme exporter protein A